MGVETSENQGLTCDICGRKFGKIQSLNIHRRYFHRIAKPGKISKLLKKRVKVDPVLVKKKIIKPKLTKITPLTMSPPKLRTNVASRSVNEISTEKIKAVRKPMFQCPKCFKLFNVYFSAYKHIQKNHCVDANNHPVEPNSSQLIKPIRVDPCDICMTPKIDSHTCTKSANTKVDGEDHCMCLGCQKTFDNLELFEEHVKQLHASNVESYFFPNNSEYTAWKTELEKSTKSKFTPRNSDTKAKPLHQIHHCSHQPSLEMTKTLLCPSFLRITEFKNGNFVFYYKEHFGHTCTEFSSTKYKKYCISPYLKDFVIKNIDNENSIYEQFKVITNNIISNSAEVDVSVLNTLFSKVLEMAIILNGSGQNSEQIAVKKKMTNDQITEVLAEVKTYPSRRKPDMSGKNVKKVTQENENLKVNSPVTTSGETLPTTQVNRSVLQSPPSFNDTYKDFVDQTISKQILETTLPTPQKNAVKKKIVMKTKIGQFKPSLSPKETTTVPLPKISPKRKLSSPTTVPSKKPKPLVLTKTSGKAAISPQPKKDSNKTSKLTQETKTPSKTPLNTTTSKEKPMLSKKAEILKSKNFKVIPDIKYEVKEQENDCNILILKI